jgi:1-acyl-sn-glycerol-3-phosphate acyltransferase
VSTRISFEFPASYPRRHGRITRAIGRAIMRITGWTFAGDVPDVPKLIITVAPHTSNWDFPVGVMALWALDLKLSFIGKHTLFRGVFGRWMRSLGGIPVDRSKSHGVVGEVVAAFNSTPRMVFVLAPEGTRAPAGAFKSGFLHIAQGAQVPILLAYFDFDKRIVGFGPMITPSRDSKADLEAILKFYEPIHGKYVKHWQAARRETK